MTDKSLSTICILCPVGCRLKVTQSGESVKVSGNACRRGEGYGREELTRPHRTVTTLIRRAGGGYLPVKTGRPVPKERIFDVLKAVKQAELPPCCGAGCVAISDVLGLGVDVVVTRDPPARAKRDCGKNCAD